MGRGILVVSINANEERVLRGMWAASAANGHDFGIRDEVKVKGFTHFQIAGHFSKLEEKGYIEMHEAVRVNGQGPKRRQFECLKPLIDLAAAKGWDDAKPAKAAKKGAAQKPAAKKAAKPAAAKKTPAKAPKALKQAA